MLIRVFSSHCALFVWLYAFLTSIDFPGIARCFSFVSIQHFNMSTIVGFIFFFFFFASLRCLLFVQHNLDCCGLVLTAISKCMNINWNNYKLCKISLRKHLILSSFNVNPHFPQCVPSSEKKECCSILLGWHFQVQFCCTVI